MSQVSKFLLLICCAFAASSLVTQCSMKRSGYQYKDAQNSTCNCQGYGEVCECSHLYGEDKESNPAENYLSNHADERLQNFSVTQNPNHEWHCPCCHPCCERNNEDHVIPYEHEDEEAGEDDEEGQELLQHYSEQVQLCQHVACTCPDCNICCDHGFEQANEDDFGGDGDEDHEGHELLQDYSDNILNCQCPDCTPCCEYDEEKHPFEHPMLQDFSENILRSQNRSFHCPNCEDCCDNYAHIYIRHILANDYEEEGVEESGEEDQIGHQVLRNFSANICRSQNRSFHCPNCNNCCDNYAHLHDGRMDMQNEEENLASETAQDSEQHMSRGNAALIASAALVDQNQSYCPQKLANPFRNVRPRREDTSDEEGQAGSVDEEHPLENDMRSEE